MPNHRAGLNAYGPGWPSWAPAAFRFMGSWRRGNRAAARTLVQRIAQNWREVGPVFAKLESEFVSALHGARISSQGMLKPASAYCALVFEELTHWAIETRHEIRDRRDDEKRMRALHDEIDRAARCLVELLAECRDLEERGVRIGAPSWNDDLGDALEEMRPGWRNDPAVDGFLRYTNGTSRWRPGISDLIDAAWLPGKFMRESLPEAAAVTFGFADADAALIATRGGRPDSQAAQLRVLFAGFAELAQNNQFPRGVPLDWFSPDELSTLCQVFTGAGIGGDTFTPEVIERERNRFRATERPPR